jgi:cob(I)alamin adenosyltransferase
MSIVTKRGDDGQSDLLFGKRTAKTDPRFEAVGAVDELNAALGVARAAASDRTADAIIDRLQEKLVGLMGELAVLPEDARRYAESDFPSLSDEEVQDLEREAAAVEAEGISFKGWARPGANGNLAGAHLDLARTVCRRAERRVLALGSGVSNPAIAHFLNRASDLLWLLARKTEKD